MIAQFAVSTVFWYYERPLVTYAILLASALDRLGPVSPGARRDDLLPVLVPGARATGRIPTAGSRPFDLGIGERYRQERIRARELRDRGASVEGRLPDGPRAGQA